MKEIKTIISIVSYISLFSLICLMTACSSGGDDAVAPAPTPVTEVAISFGGNESQEVAVNNGTNRANRANGPYGAYRPYRRAAGAPLSASETTFNVWGYKNMAYSAEVYGETETVCPGYQVEWHDGSAATTLTNSSGWEYILPAKSDQTIKYWDWSAKAYRFFAATKFVTEAVPATPDDYEADKTYGANETYGPTEAYGAYAFSMLADASPEETAEATAAKRHDTPYFSRLWFSTGNQVTYPDKLFGKPVTLEFVKPYTRVRFLFIYSYPREGIKLTDKMFRPTSDVEAAEEDKVKIARKGAVTVHYPTEGTAIKEWYSVEVDADKSTRLSAFTEDYDPEDDGKEYTETDKGWYMVIPNNAQGTYTLSVSVNGETKKTVVPANYMQWLPGYSYTYVFKITLEGGVEIGWVEYAMTPWKEMEADWTVYNW